MKFYFHLRSGHELTLDNEGAEFADYAAALREVTLAARELLEDAIRTGKPHRVDALVIADGFGRDLAACRSQGFWGKPTCRRPLDLVRRRHQHVITACSLLRLPFDGNTPPSV